MSNEDMLAFHDAWRLLMTPGLEIKYVFDSKAQAKRYSRNVARWTRWFLNQTTESEVMLDKTPRSD